jgi:hypothetical protein
LERLYGRGEKSEAHCAGLQGDDQTNIEAVLWTRQLAFGLALAALLIVASVQTRMFSVASVFGFPLS